jgi:hypothetical protein
MISQKNKIARKIPRVEFYSTQYKNHVPHAVATGPPHRQPLSIPIEEDPKE